MVIKGGARGGPAALAAHLERTDTNERVTLRELRGVTARDLVGALREMDSMGAAADSRRTLYHAQINTAPGEVLTEEQKRVSVERLEKAMCLEGQARAVVEHVKRRKGQEQAEEHMHVTWLRIDLKTMTAISDSHNYRKHEEVARELEREFGHKLTLGAHVRDKKREPRPARTPSHAEMQQAARSAITPQEAKARITELWQQADTGKAFAAALENDGWILARGDRRDFMILDRAGETHSLGKRIDGVRAAQIRERMADVDLTRLPSVEEARVLYKARENDRRQVGQPEPPADLKITLLKVTPPPNQQLGRPLELSQNTPPRPSAEDRRPAISAIAEPIPEALPPPPKRDEIEQQPAPAMFRQLFTAAAEITQLVLDKARQLFDRQRHEDAKQPVKLSHSEPIQQVEIEEEIIIRMPAPPQQPEHIDHVITAAPPAAPADSMEKIRERVEREHKNRPSKTPAEQLREQLERERSREYEGPEL